MKTLKTSAILALCSLALACSNKENTMKLSVFETSRSGHKLTKIDANTTGTAKHIIKIDTSKTYQTFTGFGGAFTESSAYLLNRLSPEKRDEVIQAYFAEDGANYSLARTHMNSCDFSLSQYSYAPVEGDTLLQHFSIEEDRNDLIPMIKDAMKASKNGFRLFASPWTAPPWMKTNNDWVGGELKPEYYDTWALFFSKYADAYKAEGIDLWGFTVENEPHGNGNNWESMHFTPQEMTTFVREHLGPSLEASGKGDLVVLGYDQNREGIKEWVDEMYKNEANAKYYDGTAIHWYESTFEVFPEALQYAHQKAPNKYLIQTEACVDAEVPKWKNDDWYWQKEATDWGWDWAPEEQKHLHPKYRPVYRYARDIIGCMNNWVDGWVDWNMVLDKEGGPNWFKNWCVAPVIVDPENDEIYFTPLYYTMAHFSKYIRPGAKRIDVNLSTNELQVSAVTNPNGEHVVIVFNPGMEDIVFELQLGIESKTLKIQAQALQSIIL